jgi:predicted extracellular nuclease
MLFCSLQDYERANVGVDNRLRESNAIRDLIFNITDPSKVIVLGSLHENWWVSPIRNLEGAGLKNLVKDMPENERYNANGNIGAVAFDYILVGQDLCTGTFGEYIRVNSEFFVGPSFHDPMVACIPLKP